MGLELYYFYGAGFLIKHLVVFSWWPNNPQLTWNPWFITVFTTAQHGTLPSY